MIRPKDMPEKGRGGLQEAVRSACATLGLAHYHTFDSRRSEKGFPDSLIFVERPAPWLCVAELKAEGKRTSPEQVAILDRFAELDRLAPGIIGVFLWRPTHWLNGEIFDLLMGNLRISESSALWVAGSGVDGDKFSLPFKGRGK
jgi:hypothetical protein